MAGKIPCPDCRRVLSYKGDGKYLCENEQCSVIEVQANTHMKPPVISRVKRAAKLINRPDTPFHSGVCPNCGRIVERLGDISIGVCTGGRRDKHPPVEIKLRRGVYENNLEAKQGEAV